MKRCPTCSRVYDDDNLRFCLDDGTNLVDKRLAEQAPETLFLPTARDAVPTMKAFTPPPAPISDARVDATPEKRNPILWIAGAVLLILFAGGFIAGVLIIYKKTSYKWHLVVQVDAEAPDRDAAVKQTVKVIESRLNAYGVSSYRIAPEDDGRIKVDLPAIDDPERVKALIISEGKLELMHVISSPNPTPVQTYTTIEEAVGSYRNGDNVKPDRRLAEYDETGRSLNPKYVVLEEPAIVDGSELRGANAMKSIGREDYQINFYLNPTGAQKFGNWTASNINEYLAVVLNKEVKSIAFIRSSISDAGVIEGRFTKQSAEDLALVLKAGALPAPVKLVEETLDK